MARYAGTTKNNQPVWARVRMTQKTSAQLVEQAKNAYTGTVTSLSRISERVAAVFIPIGTLAVVYGLSVLYALTTSPFSTVSAYQAGVGVASMYMGYRVLLQCIPVYLSE